MDMKIDGNDLNQSHVWESLVWYPSVLHSFDIFVGTCKVFADDDQQNLRSVARADQSKRVFLVHVPGATRQLRSLQKN